MHYNDDDSPACHVCNGDLMLLGNLGSRYHFRCRHCGMDQSIVVSRHKLTRMERLQGLADSGVDTWEDYRGER